MADKTEVETPPSNSSDTPSPAAGSEKGSVPTEGDIIAIKRGHENEVKGLKESHEGIVTKLNSQISDMTNAQSQFEAKVKTLEESSATSEATTQKLTEAEVKVGELTTLVESLTGEVTGTLRKQLTSLGIPEEKLDGRPIHELKLMEVAASSVAPANSNGYATGGGGSAAASPGDPMAKYHQIVAEGEKKIGQAVPASSEEK